MTPLLDSGLPPVEDGPLPVLAEGPGWLVVDKPSRVIVHYNPQNRNGERPALQRVRDQVGRPVYLIHRLDRQASGCLLFATLPELAGPLSACLNGPDSEKEYLAFVRGRYKLPSPQVIETPMKDSRGVLREARSVVRCLGASEEPRCSLLHVAPETGRFHQVRRHVRDLGHPILGDGEHGDSRVNRDWREGFGLNRLGLHARRLSMPLPDGGRLDVVAPLPEDLRHVLCRMPWWEDVREAVGG